MSSVPIWTVSSRLAIASSVKPVRAGIIQITAETVPFFLLVKFIEGRATALVLELGFTFGFARPYSFLEVFCGQSNQQLRVTFVRHV